MEKYQRPLLSKFTVDELCEIYSKLNRWEWDERLGNAPPGWDDMILYKRHIWDYFEPTRQEIINPIMRNIECIVGHKRLMRYHHIHNLHRTEADFQEWWENQLYEGQNRWRSF